MWRQFDPGIEELAKTCRAQASTDEIFSVIGTPAGGGSLAVPIRMADSGLFAWAKPARRADDNASHAAHEKIAADLAYEIGLPIAPVILSERADGCGLPVPVVALSYVALPQGRPWGQFGKLSPEELEDIQSVLSAMYVYHAWIDDHDHNWNVGNALLERLESGRVRVAFIDYGHSLTRQWAPPNPPPSRTWERPGAPYAPLHLAAVQDAIERINKIPINVIQGIIYRIPSKCLPPGLAEPLANGLASRRSQLGEILGLEGAP